MKRYIIMYTVGIHIFTVQSIPISNYYGSTIMIKLFEHSSLK